MTNLECKSRNVLPNGTFQSLGGESYGSLRIKLSVLRGEVRALSLSKERYAYARVSPVNTTWLMYTPDASMPAKGNHRLIRFYIHTKMHAHVSVCVCVLVYVFYVCIRMHTVYVYKYVLRSGEKESI